MAGENSTKATVRQYVAALDAILRDVLADVPCYTGPMPARWTDVIIRRLRERKVPDRLIPVMLDQVRRMGYDLTDSVTSRAIDIAVAVTSAPLADRPPTFREGLPPTEAELRATQKYYEERIWATSASGNDKEAERLARELARLIDAAVRSTELGQKDGEVQHGQRLDPPKENTTRRPLRYSPRPDPIPPRHPRPYRTPGR